MVQIRSGSASITGNFRENNEDRCFVDPQSRYFLVADGMGGQAAGEKASQLAIEIISGKLEKSLDSDEADQQAVISRLDEAVADANGEIMALGEIDPNYHSMGTTIVFLVFVGGKGFAGGVGDSRVYRLAEGEFQQLTVDHSLTQALVDAGTISPEDAETHRYRNMLYRYLGSKEGSAGTKPMVFDVQPGTRFVLCSDGVTDGLEDGEVSRLLAEQDDPQQAADAIVSAAQEGGSKDNITCVVVHVE